MGGIASATIPGTAGAGKQTHDIKGTEHTIQINADMSVGQVYDANGRPTGIKVSMTWVDDAGNPTGLTPLSEQDTQALSTLTGNEIGSGCILDTSVNSEGVDEPDGTSVQAQSETHLIDGTDGATIQVDASGQGTVSVNGVETTVSATPTDFDDEGNLTGFAPSTPADVEAQSDGSQTWVSTQNGTIQNAGSNAEGEHRPFDPQTGLSRPSK